MTWISLFLHTRNGSFHAEVSKTREDVAEDVADGVGGSFSYVGSFEAPETMTSFAQEASAILGERAEEERAENAYWHRRNIASIGGVL